MTVVAIMQPTYLPWLGYFDLIDQVETFVFLDDVQVLARSWGVRNRIRTTAGELLLTVPLMHSGPREERLFYNTPIDYAQPWHVKHCRTIAQNYGKSPGFAELYPALEALLGHRYASIGELNMACISYFAEQMSLRAGFARSSELPFTPGAKDERLVGLCRRVGARRYLSAKGSADYIEAASPGGAFARSDIELHYQDFAHPTYPQAAEPFISHLSVVDAVMNCGFEETRRLIRRGRRPSVHYSKFREHFGD